MRPLLAIDGDSGRRRGVFQEAVDLGHRVVGGDVQQQSASRLRFGPDVEYAVYEEDGSSRVDAVEPEKGVGQIRSPQLNDRGLELRKRLIKTIKSLERADTRV